MGCFCNLAGTLLRIGLYCVHYQIYHDEVYELGEEIQVRMFPITRTSVRATFHLDVAAEDVDAAVKKIKYVVENHCRVSAEGTVTERKGKRNENGYI